jgi:predicted ATPase
MQILSLKTKGHPILKDLDLVFSNNNNTPVHTVVIAGENGVGKSTIINLLFDVLSFNFKILKKTNCISVEIVLSKNEINLIRYKDEKLEIFDNSLQDGKLEIIFNSQKKDIKTKVILRFNDLSGRTQNIKDSKSIKSFLTSEEVKIVLGSFFYDSKDHTKKSIIKENPYARRFTQNSKNNSGATLKRLISEYVQEKAREERSKHKGLLGTLNSLGVDTIKNSNEIETINGAISMLSIRLNFNLREINKNNVFINSNNDQMKYNDLSSGEKHLIDLTTFFKYSSSNINGAIVFIDEPENSLHPAWQKSVIPFLQSLLNQNQLFIITHSPFIIHRDTIKNEKIILLKKNKDNIISEGKPSFPNWTKDNLVHQAFKVKLSSQKKPILYTEGRTDELYLKTALKLIGSEKQLDIRWVGKLENNKESFTGSSALRKIKDYASTHQDIFNSEIFLLFDSDENETDIDKGKLHIRKLTFFNDTVFKKGIENILDLNDNLIPLCDFYSSKTELGGYGEKKVIESFNKMSFSKHICNDLQEDAQRIILNRLIKYLEEFVLPDL